MSSAWPRSTLLKLEDDFNDGEHCWDALAIRLDVEEEEQVKDDGQASSGSLVRAVVSGRRLDLSLEKPPSL